MKKIIRLFISFFVILSSVVVLTEYVACAESYGDFTYVINNGTVTITDCDSYASGNIEIPDRIDGYPVTAIGDYAFSGCSNMTNITIPGSVTIIGNYAFYECYSLKSITIPDSVTSIGKMAFYYCSNLTSITIPGSVTNIGNSAFSGCSSLTSITIPDSVTSIGDDAFFYCSSLTSITIPASITGIGDYAFFGCNNLKEVHISDITAWCNISFDNFDSNPLSNDASLYLNGEIVKDLTIPNSVTSIGEMAFYYCSSLTSITIPGSVTSIGNSAFFGCSSLTSITIPDSVTSIGDDAFSRCFELTDIYYAGSAYKWLELIENTSIPSKAIIHCNDDINIANGGKCGDNLRWILDDKGILTISGNGEMSDYSVVYNYGNSYSTAPWKSLSVKNVIISSGVTSIGNCAFYGCKSLISVTVPDSVTSIGDYAFEYCSSLTSITISASVTSIGDSAFYGCNNLKEVHISDITAWCNISFGNFDSNPLSNAAGLYLNGELVKDLTIPDSITNVGNYAFYDYSSLASVTIPESVTSIGNSAFSGCGSLTSITIPDSVTSIGDDAFLYCYSLKEVHISDMAAWCNIAFGNNCSNPLNYRGNLYLNGEIVKDLTIPNSVTSIGNYAFYGCKSLTSITVPDSVTRIGDYAFDDCNSLKSITIPNSVTSIGSSAFSYCYSLKEVYISDIVSWCNIAFGNNHSNPLNCTGNLYLNGEIVKNLTIPNGVTSIGNCAFYGCKSLTSITVPDSVTSIGDYAFEYCSSLTSVTIPNSVESINKYAFSNCSSLKEVHIADIAAWCNISFNDYSNPLSNAASLYLNGEIVKDLIIPDSVTDIGSSAFENCSGLTSVTIPDSVAAIGNSAFYNCGKLKNIYYNGTEEEWSKINIGSNAIPANATIHSLTYVTGVSLDIESLNLLKGGKRKLMAAISPSDASNGNVVWSSSNENVASVENGLITAVGAGTAIITVTTEDGGYTASCSVTVMDFAPESDFRFENGTITKYLGTSKEVVIPKTIFGVKVTAIGEYAFSDCGIKSVTLPLCIEAVADNAFTNSGLEDLYYEGTSNDWSKVSVGGDAIPENVNIHINIGVTGISLNKTKILLTPEKNEQLTAEIEPKDAQNKNVIWTSADESVAVVNNGKVTGVAYGKTVITVTAEDGGYLAKCEIGVYTPASEFVFANGSITGYSGTDTEVYIPDEIDGIKVTGIGSEVFKGRTTLKNVVIPDGVTSIDTGAFYNCGNLESITIPASVTSIGENVFYNCVDLKKVHISDIAAWCNISFGSTYSNPLYYAKKLYMNDSPITDLIIPNGVTSINKYAFYNCGSLTSITIPASVTSIGGAAFYNCGNLESITIPASVTSIGENAFYNCVDLKKVHISDIAAWCNISFGNSCSNPLYYAKKLYMNDRPITDLIIPDGFTIIKNYAFYNCSGLTSVTIPSSVIIIGDDSFCGCKIDEVHISDIAAWCNISFGSNPLSYASALYVNGVLTEDLVIPSGVTGVGTVFKGFKGLKSIVLPRTVSKIEDNAFSYCNNLTSVTLPNSITQIGNSAFAYCSNLSSADLPSSVITVGKRAFYQCNLAEVNIGASTSYIGKNAFNGCKLKKITLNKNNRNYVLQSNVLYNSDKTSIVLCAYDAVTEVTIPGTVSKIDEEAFYRCVNLKSVIISDGVTTIGENAFSSCGSLTSVKIPKSVTEIGYDAFSYCNNLKEVHISDIAAWCNISSANNPLSNESAMLYLDDTPIVDLVIPYGVTNIASYVFSDYGSLESITIPGSVTSIDGWAFRNCTGLKSVVLPESITEIGERTFEGCNALTNIIIPSSVTKIGALAFNNCGALTSINIPAKVKSINTVYGTLATVAPFSNCGNLTDITVDENNVNYCSENGVLFNKSKTDVIKYPEGKEDLYYEMPHGVENIRFRAFDNCKNLTSIKLSDTLNSIEGSDRYNLGVVFSGCKNLSRIDVDENNNRYYSNDGVLFDKKGTLVRYPEGIEKTVYGIPDDTANIGNFAFYNCDNPKEIKIPHSLKSVEENAFNTAAVENVYYDGTKADRENVSIAEGGNSSLLTAVWHYQGEDDGESKPVVKVSEVFGKRGTAVTMNIVLENNPGAALLGFDIGYDKNAMTLVSVTNGEIFDDADILNGNIQKNPYMFTCINSKENKTGDGVLISLTFKISDNCPSGDYAINISGCEAYSIDETVVDFKSVNGKVIVSDGMQTGINISVNIPNYEKGGTVIAGLYDKSGKLLSVKSYAPAKSVNVSFEKSGAYVKVMQWDMNMMPLAEHKEIYPN